MSVVIETTLGTVTVDLYLTTRPRACLNFLKLCKMKYYNYNLFHTISRGFIAQTGDPTGSRSGGESVYGVLDGPEKRYFEGENEPRIKHTKMGLISFVGNEQRMIGSQFFLSLGEDLTYLDEKHCVFGEVVEGFGVLEVINEVICDTDDRPYQDVRITHTVILDDPYPDPKKLRAPSRSPSPSVGRLKGGRIAPDEDIDETEGKTVQEVTELQAEREAKARATILEMVGDIPDADMAPPENVLFVCKLNPVTSDDDLEVIFNRFGKIKSCEVIRDRKTGDSLQYAFIEFEERKSCEDAYFKMDNILIDDRRIHVDFSQSVSKVKWLGKGRGVKHYDDRGRISNKDDKNIGKGDYKQRNNNRNRNQIRSPDNSKSKRRSRSRSNRKEIQNGKSKSNQREYRRSRSSSPLGKSINRKDFSKNDRHSHRREISRSRSNRSDESGSRRRNRSRSLQHKSNSNRSESNSEYYNQKNSSQSRTIYQASSDSQKVSNRVEYSTKSRCRSRSPRRNPKSSKHDNSYEQSSRDNDEYDRNYKRNKKEDIEETFNSKEDKNRRKNSSTQLNEKKPSKTIHTDEHDHKDKLIKERKDSKSAKKRSNVKSNPKAHHKNKKRKPSTSESSESDVDRKPKKKSKSKSQQSSSSSSSDTSSTDSSSSDSSSTDSSSSDSSSSDTSSSDTSTSESDSKSRKKISSNRKSKKKNSKSKSVSHKKRNK